MGLLSFVFLLFLVIMTAIGVILYSLYRSFHDTARLFKDRMTGKNRQRNKGNFKKRNYFYRSRTENGDVIIDKRDPVKINQKIFKKNEGEYVDFKEIEED